MSQRRCCFLQTGRLAFFTVCYYLETRFWTKTVFVADLLYLLCVNVAATEKIFNTSCFYVLNTLNNRINYATKICDLWLSSYSSGLWSLGRFRLSSVRPIGPAWDHRITRLENRNDDKKLKKNSVWLCSQYKKKFFNKKLVYTRTIFRITSHNAILICIGFYSNVFTDIFDFGFTGGH